MKVMIEKRQCQECYKIFYVEAEVCGTRTANFYHCVSCGEKNSERLSKISYKDVEYEEC